MSFKIAGNSVEKGRKKTFFLKTAELPIGQVELPVTIINGVEQGPTLFVSAGIHGTEYPGIKAAQIIAQKHAPEDIHGTLLVLHCANVPMFNAKTAFVNPIDGLNFNRIFPGEPKSTGFYGPGSISHHITNYIYENLMSKSSHYIDLHGGDLTEFCPLFSISFKSGDEKVDNVTERMLKYTLADYVELRPKSQSLTTIATASRTNIPNTLIESGGAGLLTKQFVEKHVSGIENIMKSIELLEGIPKEPIGQIKLDGTRSGIRAGRGGFFTSYVDAGEEVRKGQKIGEITNAFGETIQEIEATKSGIITIINFPAAKNVGDPLFDIAGIS